ncbi:TonB-dependent receptor [Erythrobacter oryzae]|uniref:TonB-dependent receptor n=1 Tax=Erythrobacter oryzae TaxID=3019556 RepID=UPI00255581AA|nr:TonB-dependent receptor [Erythrobacter sp. COR-2]
MIPSHLLLPSLLMAAASPAVADAGAQPAPAPAAEPQPAPPPETPAPGIALVNRSEENVITQASDAFGTSVGDETIGLYSGGNVRGFSAFAAQNVRIEGLYFDSQGAFSDAVRAGSSIQVGISALGYPFPAPTGIVDFALRRVGDKPVVSARTGLGDFLAPFVSVDAALPLGGSLDLNIGTAIEEFAYPDAADFWFVRYGGVMRWRPAEGVELTGFYSRYDYFDEEQTPVIFTAGAFLPRRIARNRFYGQDWADWAGHSQNFGGLAKLARGPWRVSAGLFSSRFTIDRFGANFFANTRPDGTAERQVLLGRDQRTQSYSGELLVEREFTEGPRRHRLLASARFRRVDDDLGGFVFRSLGPGTIDVADPLPEPDVTFGALTRDAIRQHTGALGYGMQWQGLGELNLGVQKTRYRKEVRAPGRASTANTDSPVLWNASAAITAINGIAIYAATTRGLEESGTAPSFAANANLTLPALRTRQIEAGLRWTLAKDVKLIAGLFDVRRPYFELDSDNVFRVLGDVKHQGAEISLTARPVPGLNVVAGAVLMRPRVTGEAVEQGRLGERPLGRVGTTLDLRLDYQPPAFDALSVDLGINYTGARAARIDNALFIPERAIVDLGGRYRFKLGRTPTVLRAQIANLTNTFGWNVTGGGGFQFIPSRRFNLSLSADF